jgi:hypothetical protein
MSDTQDTGGSQSKTTIQREVVFRVSKTRKGVKVTQRDGRGLADGYFTKPRQQYFYGDNAEEKAVQYAENRAEEIDDETRIVELGEKT